MLCMIMGNTVLILGIELKKNCGHLEHVYMRVTGMVKGLTSLIQKDQGSIIRKSAVFIYRKDCYIQSQLKFFVIPEDKQRRGSHREMGFK